VPTRVSTDSGFIILHGDNAQGKTSVLEAVHVLATLKSFRESRTRRWIQIGAEQSRLSAQIQTELGMRSIQWTWVDGVRNLKLDGVGSPKLSAWFSSIRAVVFCPEDIAIIRGDPGLRRGFIDRAAFTLRPGHLGVVQDYRRVLRHKVVLLKHRVQSAELSTYDFELARLGARLIFRRREVIAALQTPLQDLHTEIAGEGQLRMRLRSRGLSGVEETEEEIRASLTRAMAEASSDEIQRAQALIGPHRDEVLVHLDDKLARNFASQGQARSIVLALKLAQWSAAGAQGDPPLFLLDDLGSELDLHRRGRLLDLLRGLPGQVWLTTTDLSFVDSVPRAERLELGLSGGQISCN
jgi:DNA replication and repair protein RecF